MLLGDKNAGKTTIRRALCGKKALIELFEREIESKKEETRSRSCSSHSCSRQRPAATASDVHGSTRRVSSCTGCQYFLSAENLIVLLVFNGLEAMREYDEAKQSRAPFTHSSHIHSIKQTRSESVPRRWLCTVRDIVSGKDLQSCRTVLVATHLDSKAAARESFMDSAFVREVCAKLRADYGSAKVELHREDLTRARFAVASCAFTGELDTEGRGSAAVHERVATSVAGIAKCVTSTVRGDS